jgi:predicted metal-dependent phosphoesterase TrpH
MLKANLHFHAGDDPEHRLDYTVRTGIDRAHALGFQVLAVTCHHRVLATREDEAYARERGILLIPGVELTVEGCHVVVLNVDRTAESARTFGALAAFRTAHPECFVIAPHPYFRFGFSLGAKLERHRECFDAIECSWFHSRSFDLNRRAERFASDHGLPYLATSDTHYLHHLDRAYASIDAREPTAAAVFRAIREGRFTNTAPAVSFWRTMVLDVGIREVTLRARKLFSPSVRVR